VLGAVFSPHNSALNTTKISNSHNAKTPEARQRSVRSIDTTVRSTSRWADVYLSLRGNLPRASNAVSWYYRFAQAQITLALVLTQDTTSRHVLLSLLTDLYIR
jgi:hypothetical protein